MLGFEPHGGGSADPVAKCAMPSLVCLASSLRTGTARGFCSRGSQSMCPGDIVLVFAMEDDHAIGVLSSLTHQEWARAQSSTLEDRFRYTPTSAFETFPWPQPDEVQREAVAEAGRRLIVRRSEICLERQIGLEALQRGRQRRLPRPAGVARRARRGGRCRLRLARLAGARRTRVEPAPARAQPCDRGG